MFHHIKDLQFNERVSRPDLQFAKLILEQFAESKGEFKSVMRFLVQTFFGDKSIRNTEIYFSFRFGVVLFMKID